MPETQSGGPGARGPVPIEDLFRVEKTQRFDQEQILERVVHAGGYGAHGYFELTNSLEGITNALGRLSRAAFREWISSRLEPAGQPLNDPQKLLARYARLDPEILRPITHRTVEQQQALTLIRARNVLVRLRTASVNAVRGLTKSCGHRMPATTTRCFVKRSLAVMPQALAQALTRCLTRALR